jgi:hypothetical protein
LGWNVLAFYSEGRVYGSYGPMFIAALEKFALPKLSAYDSTEKVVELLKLCNEKHRKVDVIVFDAREKLALLTSH